MKKLNTAVVGLGRIAWSDHIPALLKNPAYDVTCVTDPIAGRGRETCEKFGIKSSYTSLGELLKKESPEVVVIASPTLFHAENTIMALEHGSHVFCDKPAAMGPEQFQMMIDASEKSGKKLMIFQPRRLYNDALAMKEIIFSGKLGKIYQIKFFIGNYARRNDWQCLKRNGGGMLFNYGAHYVDESMSILRSRLSLRECITKVIASAGDADDVVKLVLESDTGITVDIDINQAAALSPFSRVVYGEYGAALLGSGDTWKLRFFDPADMPAVKAESGLAAENRHYPSQQVPFKETEFTCKTLTGNPIEQYLANFCDVIENEAPPLVSVSETLALMNLLHEAAVKAEEHDRERGES